ncbi:hypothetical protein PybrP1_004984 [[Pythium] brassicae (nom. inval.)]|nr:hypothetical protein PybrP1_004984 [[Pythium] brassicae (nom. inval.)]
MNDGCPPFACAPGSLACTHAFSERVAFARFNEYHLEGRVMAAVPPSITLPPRIAEITLMLKVLVSEQPGTAEHRRIVEWLRSVKRLHYAAATRRITFVLGDKSSATRAHRIRVRLNGVWLTLLSLDQLEKNKDPTAIYSVARDEAAPSNTSESAGARSQRRRRGAVDRVCRRGAALARAPVRQGHGYLRHQLLGRHFRLRRQPHRAARGNAIVSGDTEVFIHHFKRHTRIPWFKFYVPTHVCAKCGRNDDDTLVKHQRVFGCTLEQAKMLPLPLVRNMSAMERAAYIASLAALLRATGEALAERVLKTAVRMEPTQTPGSGLVSNASTPVLVQPTCATGAANVMRSPAARAGAT